MVKKLLLIVSPILLFSSQINFNKTFYKKVTADELSTNITVNVTRKIQNDINPILNKYNEIISDSKTVEKQRGNFSINPRYVYKKNISKLVGYSGNLSYTISSKKYENMNNFILELLEEKTERDLSITIATLNWKISDDLRSQTKSQLRLESIVWANTYANKLSDELSSTCNVKEININQALRYQQPRVMANRAMLADASSQSNIAVPKQGKNKISLNVNYKMECK